MPKIVLEKYRVFAQQREKKMATKTVARTSLMSSSKDLINFKKADYLDVNQTQLRSGKFGVENTEISDDRISDIEIIGTSKLKSELKYVKNTLGPKYLVRNHILNEDGEGEPKLEEEILA